MPKPTLLRIVAILVLVTDIIGAGMIAILAPWDSGMRLALAGGVFLSGIIVAAILFFLSMRR